MGRRKIAMPRSQCPALLTEPGCSDITKFGGLSLGQPPCRHLSVVVNEVPLLVSRLSTRVLVRDSVSPVGAKCPPTPTPMVFSSAMGGSDGDEGDPDHRILEGDPASLARQ